VFVCERRKVAATVNVGIYLGSGCGFDEQVAVFVERFLTTFRCYAFRSGWLPRLR
jgi:hypothetical protein